MPRKAMTHIKTVIYGLGCFFLPLIIVMMATAANDAYPFGTETFMAGDMRSQYVDFFVWYRNALLGDVDLFYTTSQMLGNPMAATFGYYLASPLNLFVILFPQEAMPLYCYVVVLVKVGLIQLACVFYVRRRFCLPRIWACVLALGFSLSTWVLTEMTNVMWLDGLIFLPLCAWGVCCLLRYGQWRLLALTYGACVLSNWYMGYMVGLFLCFYAVFEGYVLGYDGVKSTGRTHYRRLLLFMGAMALGLALSAVVFLPSALGIVNGSATEIGGHSTGFEGAHSKLAQKVPALEAVPMVAIMGALVGVVVVIVALIFVLARKRSVRWRLALTLFVMLVLCLLGCCAVPYLMFTSPVNVLTGLFLGLFRPDTTPQLYGSFVLLVLTIWLFCLRRVPLKLKLAIGLFLFLMLMSAWVMPLQVIWCGFRPPAGHYSRTAYLFVFLLLWCAAFALREILVHPDTRAGALFQKLPFQVGICLFVVVELSVRASLLLNCQYGTVSQEQFSQYEDSAIAQVEELEAYDPGVYRIKKEYWRLGENGMNEGMWDKTNRIDSYTSTGDGNVLEFLSSIGFGDGIFCTMGSNSLFPGDVLLGVKYMSTDDDPGIWEDVGLSPVQLPDGAKFYQNPYPLSLAYCVPEDIVGFQLPEGNDWECVNALATAVSGSTLPLYPDPSAREAAQLDPAAFDRMYEAVSAHQFTFEEFGGSVIRGSVEAGEGQVLLMTIPNQAGWEVRVNGNAVQPQDVANGALMAIPVSAGTNVVEMRFTPPGLILGACVTGVALVVLLFAPRIRRAVAQRSRVTAKEAA